jgi:hypothetical protein
VGDDGCFRYPGEGELVIYEIPLQTPVITYPEKRSPWEEKFEAWQWHSEADGLDKTRTSVVRLAVNGLAYVELFEKFFGLEAPEREERKALLETLLEMTDGSEAMLRGNP